MPDDWRAAAADYSQMGFSLARFFQRDEEILRDRPVRKASFLPIDSEVALDNAFALGSTETVLLFLHDPFCPISSSAYEQMERVEATVHVIDVSSHSGLGRGIQARTGIRHESPQAIVLRHGEPAWHASHGRIRTESVTQALAEDE